MLWKKFVWAENAESNSKACDTSKDWDWSACPVNSVKLLIVRSDLFS